jgi:hypothetical protein
MVLQKYTIQCDDGDKDDINSTGWLVESATGNQVYHPRTTMMACIGDLIAFGYNINIVNTGEVLNDEFGDMVSVTHTLLVGGCY